MVADSPYMPDEHVISLYLPKSCNWLSSEAIEPGAEARRQAIFSAGIAGLRPRMKIVKPTQPMCPYRQPNAKQLQDLGYMAIQSDRGDKANIV
ncbi:MAG: hypothetical protein K0A99_00705 [Desulfoarculaceae bacterium]|nr:hypothetical protein [Desulfoarculaceae bacterium]